MRKLLVLLGIGLVTLSGLFFYAERNRQESESESSIHAIIEVLKGQNSVLAGRIFDGLNRADQDALLAFQRWKKKAQMRSFLSDTALSEPDAPKWIIVSGRRIRAAGVADDALLEDALAEHLRSPDRLALYHSKGKYFLFINGRAGGQEYSAAYSPEAFFAAFRSDDGIRAWLALKDGTVAYHPLSRFIGSNAANLKPVAAGIRELSEGTANPFAREYLGIDGRGALGAWTPLPSYGLLVGSEWPQAPETSLRSSPYFWLGLGAGLLGALLLGLSLGGSGEASAAPRLFDERRLDEDALEYLERARRASAQAMDLLREREGELAAAKAAREETLHAMGELEWKISVLEGFQNALSLTGKQVWSGACELIAARSAGFLLAVYRYSPSSFSLVPESLHGSAPIPAEALEYLRDTRIFLGSPSYLDELLRTDSFQKWSARWHRQLPSYQMEFRSYPIQGGSMKGMVLACFDGRMNQHGELDRPLNLLKSLLDTAATFCEAQAQLVQSPYAKGSPRPVESASNDAGNRPRPS